MNKLFFSTLTKAVANYLNLDPESSSRLQKLHGKIIAFELLPFHFTFQCVFNESGMSIVSNDAYLAETTLRGTPLQLLGVAIAKDQRQHFFEEDITIEGNAETGQQVIDLFDELQIDWEEYTSRLIGDIPAYHVHRYLNKMCGWVKDTKTTFTQNINEYIHEEKAWLPTQEALQDFFADIDKLRLDVDRIEARLTMLSSEEQQ